MPDAGRQAQRSARVPFGTRIDHLPTVDGIEPHIQVFDKFDRDDGTFSRRDFAYHLESDLYRCPAGKELKRFRRAGREAKAQPPKDGLHRHRARKADCQACSLRDRCCPGQPMRKVLRSTHGGARDLARQIASTDA